MEKKELLYHYLLPSAYERGNHAASLPHHKRRTYHFFLDTNNHLMVSFYGAPPFSQEGLEEAIVTARNIEMYPIPEKKQELTLSLGELLVRIVPYTKNPEKKEAYEIVFKNIGRIVEAFAQGYLKRPYQSIMLEKEKTKHL